MVAPCRRGCVRWFVVFVLFCLFVCLLLSLAVCVVVLFHLFWLVVAGEGTVLVNVTTTGGSRLGWECLVSNHLVTLLRG